MTPSRRVAAGADGSGRSEDSDDDPAKGGVRRRAVVAAAVATEPRWLFAQAPAAPASPVSTPLVDAPQADGTTLTVERRDDIVLIGINRPRSTQPAGRRDPPPVRAGALRLRARSVAAGRDSLRRRALLARHRRRCRRGDLRSGRRPPMPRAQSTSSARRRRRPANRWCASCTATPGTSGTKSTWPATCGSRPPTPTSARANSHGPFLEAAQRFVREAGWGNAMRTLPLAIASTAEVVSDGRRRSPRRRRRRSAGVGDRRNRRGGPAVDAGHADLGTPRHHPRRGRCVRRTATSPGPYKTEDFLEGRRAEAEGRPPKYRGK